MADDFQLVIPVTASSARFDFQGTLEGRRVVWEATLVRLRDLPGDQGQRAFIDVGAPTARGRVLTVGLDLAQVDLPAVRKTVVMIRQWKRLAPGRHEFGPRVGA